PLEICSQPVASPALLTTGLGGSSLLLQRFAQIGRALAQLVEQARAFDKPFVGVHSSKFASSERHRLAVCDRGQRPQPQPRSVRCARRLVTIAVASKDAATTFAEMASRSGRAHSEVLSGLRDTRLDAAFPVNKILISAAIEGGGAQEMVALVLRRRIGPIRGSHPHTRRKQEVVMLISTKSGVPEKDRNASVRLRSWAGWCSMTRPGRGQNRRQKRKRPPALGPTCRSSATSNAKVQRRSSAESK